MQKLIFITTLFLCFSCTDKKRTMLCKIWQISDVQFLNEKESIVQSDTMQGNQQEVAKSILRELLMKNIYEFKDDGTYITGNSVASTTGYWKLAPNAIRFISKKKDEEKEKLIPIEKLQEDTLILLLRQDQTSLNVKLVMTPVTPK